MPLYILDACQSIDETEPPENIQILYMDLAL